MQGLARIVTEADIFGEEFLGFRECVFPIAPSGFDIAVMYLDKLHCNIEKLIMQFPSTLMPWPFLLSQQRRNYVECTRRARHRVSRPTNA